MAVKSRYRWKHALVTGASAGIGQQIARVLAANGVNLVLVARDAARLNDLSHELSTKYRIHVEVLSEDLTAEKGIAAVEARLRQEGDAIDLLVNNAGFGTVGRFYQLPVADELKEIQLNAITLVRLTHAATTRMVERGFGNVLNISSISGIVPGPATTIYCSTKAFVTMFTESLSGELSGTGVSITAIHPGYTVTEFQARSGMDVTIGPVPSFMWMTAEAVANYSLNAAARGTVIGVPGLGYRILVSILSSIPRSWRRAIGTNAAKKSHLTPLSKA
jgi:uncharacterized protein